MEKLQVQLNRSVSIDVVDIDDEIDIEFKPGLYRQTEGFLKGGASDNFIEITEHYEHVTKTYAEIAPLLGDQ